MLQVPPEAKSEKTALESDIKTFFSSLESALVLHCPALSMLLLKALLNIFSVIRSVEKLLYFFKGYPCA